MFLKWLPVNFILSRMAKSYGIIDPVMVLARIRRFSQPSEVQEPLELVKAGIIFQARGLINTRVFQYNLDWIWPFWVERQYNPNDRSFVPRAYSFSHINLTHRNWTAVGLPDLPLYPIVDPRGLITPLYDGWSLDFWVIPPEGPPLLPSKLPHVNQQQLLGRDLMVITEADDNDLHLKTIAELKISDKIPKLQVQCTGQAPDGGWLVAALRPCNPEGVSFIEEIKYNQKEFLVNDETQVFFDQSPEKVLFSDFNFGDVFYKLGREETGRRISCRAGLSTGAAMFRLRPREKMSIGLTIPLDRELKKNFPKVKPSSQDWHSVLSETAGLKTPDSRINGLYDSAVQTLTLLSAEDIYPGPYNYRRFWFRDACLMINALLGIGLKGRSKRLINSFPARQKITGFFQSQNGEWDSNGQVLWIMDRYMQLTGEKIPEDWIPPLSRGVQWLLRKRVTNAPGTRHQGLLPSGFSAEHLGPNDYYYWDNFWGLAGLRGGARLFKLLGLTKEYEETLKAADNFEDAIWRSLVLAVRHTADRAFPAAPYRRMDAGAIGSMVADYPLQLLPPDNARIMATLGWLMKNCFYRGGFFQDMIHSGTNCYLTLSLAQTLLRADDPRYRDLIRTTADLASPTGHWPEAVHPFTGGGCMGDGQHGWAAAEWVMIIRNLFIREEEGKLIVGSGVFPEWLAREGKIFFGPTPTPFGDAVVEITGTEEGVFLAVNGELNREDLTIEARLPGSKPLTVKETNRSYKIVPEES